MLEIVLTNYVICYVQTYLFKDFDESDRFGKNEELCNYKQHETQNEGREPHER